MLLERKFDSDSFYTRPKKPKFFRESVVFPSVQLASKKDFKFSNEELLMIIYGTIESNIIIFTNTIIAAQIHVLNLVSLCSSSYQFTPATTISVPVFYHLGIMI